MNVFWDPFNTIAHPIPVGTNTQQVFFWGDFGDFNFSGYCIGSAANGQCNQFSNASSSGGTIAVPEPSTLWLARNCHGDNGARTFIKDVLTQDKNAPKPRLFAPSHRIQVSPSDVPS